MKFWHRLSRRFTRKKYEGQVVLSRAYQSVFRGSPDRAQQEMVLADLAAQCGFYKTASVGISGDALLYLEGKRAAFQIIQSHLTLSSDDIAALENAARHETLDIENSPNFYNQ